MEPITVSKQYPVTDISLLLQPEILKLRQEPYDLFSSEANSYDLFMAGYAHGKNPERGVNLNRLIDTILIGTTTPFAIIPGVTKIVDKAHDYLDRKLEEQIQKRDELISLEKEFGNAASFQAGIRVRTLRDKIKWTEIALIASTAANIYYNL